MIDSDLLVIWMPTRVHPRTVLDQARKFGLDITEGCGEPEIRAAWGDRSGAWFDVTGWDGEWADTQVTLPDAVHAFLQTVADAEPAGFEMVIWHEPVNLETVHTQVGLDARTLPAGVCVRVLP